MAKIKIEINNLNNVRDVLQEAYMLADTQLTQAQDEINKLASATRLQDCTMDEKAKYAKAQNDFMAMKDKAIAKKIEIAKLLSDICAHNGDTKGKSADERRNTGLDFKKIREMVDQNFTDTTGEKTKTIELKTSKHGQQ
jgi:hypothetical protein